MQHDAFHFDEKLTLAEDVGFCWPPSLLSAKNLSCESQILCSYSDNAENQIARVQFETTFKTYPYSEGSFLSLSDDIIIKKALLASTKSQKVRQLFATP